MFYTYSCMVLWTSICTFEMEEKLQRNALYNKVMGFFPFNWIIHKIVNLCIILFCFLGNFIYLWRFFVLITVNVWLLVLSDVLYLKHCFWSHKCNYKTIDFCFSLFNGYRVLEYPSCDWFSWESQQLNMWKEGTDKICLKHEFIWYIRILIWQYNFKCVLNNLFKNLFFRLLPFFIQGFGFYVSIKAVFVSKNPNQYKLLSC